MTRLYKSTSEARQIEALQAFIQQVFEANNNHDAEVISTFLINGIYQYAKTVVSMEINEINNAPTNAVAWHYLADKICKQIERYIINPNEGKNTL